MIELKVPESLSDEHEALVDALRGYAKSDDETAEAVGKLLKLLEPHVQREDDLVLPLLGALQEAATGQPLKNPGVLKCSYESYAGQYSSMLAEHVPIRQAIRWAKLVSRREGKDDVVEALDALAHHSRIEEEVLYPAALLVGKTALQHSIPPGQGGSAPRISVASGDPESSDGLSYFAITGSAVPSSGPEHPAAHWCLDENPKPS